MNRLVLLAYPKSYRDSHGDELLACLTEAHPGREWPPLREATALLRGGVQERARIVADDKSRSWWLDNQPSLTAPNPTRSNPLRG